MTHEAAVEKSNNHRAKELRDRVRRIHGWAHYPEIDVLFHEYYGLQNVTVVAPGKPPVFHCQHPKGLDVLEAAIAVLEAK